MRYVVLECGQPRPNVRWTDEQCDARLMGDLYQRVLREQRHAELVRTVAVLLGWAVVVGLVAWWGW